MCNRIENYVRVLDEKNSSLFALSRLFFYCASHYFMNIYIHARSNDSYCVDAAIISLSGFLNSAVQALWDLELCI
jgi:hypothetical protein